MLTHEHAPPLTERQGAIVDLVKQHGFASIAELAERFDVTTQTIRRDVNALCEMQVLARFHGGVGLPNSVENDEYTERRSSFQGAKDAIAAKVATLIPDRASLFLNIGTTTEAAATALLNHQDLRVVTNNLHVANILSKNPSFQVLVSGGLLRGKDGGLVGEAAIDFLQSFRLDYGIIGISGIDEDGSLLDFDHREVRAAKTIMSNARHVVLVADHSKFGRAAMAKAGKLDAIDTLVTDQRPPNEFARAIELAGVELVIA